MELRNETKDLNKLYDELQSDFLATKDCGTLGKMYEVLRCFFRRYLNKYCKDKKIVMDSDSVENDVEDMSIWVISMYITRPEFKIKRMSSYAHFGFIKILFNAERIRYERFKKSVESFNSKRFIGADGKFCGESL